MCLTHTETQSEWETPGLMLGRTRPCPQPWGQGGSPKLLPGGTYVAQHPEMREDSSAYIVLVLPV